MSEFDKRTQSNMNLVLEEVCQALSKYGGDHECRKYIAEQLIEAASAGKTTRGELEAIARRALLDLTNRKSAEPTWRPQTG